MKRILIVLILSAALLPAVDSELLGLVMPDAKVLAGANVEQARNSPFGQYVLSQMQTQDQHLQRLISQTGFDPRRDLREVLLASVGQPNPKNGILLARGVFDVARIAASATADGQAVENYKGATVLKAPKGDHAVAFLDSTLAAVGDTATVRAAIDRRSAPSQLNPAAASKVSQLSGMQDAWAVTLVPPSQLNPHIPDPNAQGLLKGDMLQKIEEASGGVKFGAIVQVNVEAVAQTDQDATALADVARFLLNMAQMNAPQRNPQAATMLQSVNISAEAKTVKISASIPEDQIERMMKPTRRRAARVVRPN